MGASLLALAKSIYYGIVCVLFTRLIFPRLNSPNVSTRNIEITIKILSIKVAESPYT